MEEKFIKGLFTKKNEKSPDFILASLSFKTEQFIEWLKDHTNQSGYCNVDVLKSKDGGVYSKHNDWQPSLVVEKDQEDLEMEAMFKEQEQENEINVGSITF